MDTITAAALDHLHQHDAAYKDEFYAPHINPPNKLGAIRKLRNAMGCGLREAKDAVEEWYHQWNHPGGMSEDEAKVLLRNLILRMKMMNGGSLKNLPGMTEMEVAAIQRMAN